MPSLSASVPAGKLKVMRPSKPVARPMPTTIKDTGMDTVAPGTGGSTGPVRGTAAPPPTKDGIMRADGGTAANGWTPQTAVPPKLATGGGFQFRPRDTVGGSMVPGGGGDIQTAIKSLRGQLGMPAPAAPGGPSLEPWQQGGGGSPDAPTSSVPSPSVPRWRQLADLGIGGQGSAAGNRGKLAELLAARAGGGGAAGIEPGSDISSGLNLPTIPGVPPGTSIRRMPATVSDSTSDLGVGDGGASLAGSQGPMGPGPAAPGGLVQNPYMDILNRRGIGGFGGFGGGGLNPGAVAAGAYAR